MSETPNIKDALKIDGKVLYEALKSTMRDAGALLLMSVVSDLRNGKSYEALSTAGRELFDKLANLTVKK